MRTYVRDPEWFRLSRRISAGLVSFGGQDVREPAGRVGNSAKEIFESFRRKRNSSLLTPNS